ncbi:MAG: glucose-1-phosphate thymidylyltransferase [Nitrosomonadales bacterium]|nr:glucose-1-phosphate thymidylyltransferase [Nitrosomonadales bacterium]|tara:strand:- start:1357 stop:2232 length:876 start_codon:yes stop_codon:yes gene_type:complete
MISNNKRKGIILAGGNGSRLYPLTKVISKQLLPVFDKPMIHYPLATLMTANIKDILVISTPKDISAYEALLGDGSSWGINISYKIQPSPDGLAQAFLLSEDFLGNDLSALILGDNIFYGPDFSDLLLKASNREEATIFAFHVEEAQRYGVVEFDDKKVISIEEKPVKPKSNFAITGLYFYDNEVIELAKSLKPSVRGELEITDLNRIYMKKNKLNVEILNKDYTWFDSGTHESLLKASMYVGDFQKRYNQKISCIEEIAYKNRWISKNDLIILAKKIHNKYYRDYLEGLID